MLTLFNRRRLHSTNSMVEQSRIRDVLEANQIEYMIKTISQDGSSLFGTSRSRGSYGVNQSAALQYVFYVLKEEFDRANHLN